MTNFIVKVAQKFVEAIPYTLLAELEPINGIRRAVASGKISRTEHDRVFREIAPDEEPGILARPCLNHGEPQFIDPQPFARSVTQARELLAPSMWSKL